MIKILLFLTAIINIAAIYEYEEEEEKLKQYDKYAYEKRKLTRVKDWKTNFKNLKSLSPFFTDEIENIKSYSDKELKHDFQFAFSFGLNSSTSDDIVPKEYKSLFEKSYTFINTLKHKNPNQAAYLIHEIYELDEMLTSTKRTLDIFKYVTYRQKSMKHNKYEHIFIKLKDIYSKATQEYFETFNILDHNDINNNFCKFMTKFTEIHNLASHVYFNMENLFKCTDTNTRTNNKTYCNKLTPTI
ncbi:hypothetical protein bcCo53_001447 (plasmid) [Borrelia coriaceae]|uniref:Uncharacterized protein n=1 Tax=Borrelia coriaceae ATCC 43381 TaxID=1408429 RepID=W5SXT5_9SPIR|nr:hypothetical protein [Borrelia coriaceae]AHH11725.1 hypothetical protein BCO_0018406 [Borrelia coriaceae ATCC 43381]UPA17269.1 hypothetical protein bcCo53_001447 [Borrelia coriaceae]